MRRKGPFVRDIELHGHHQECETRRDSCVEYQFNICNCRDLDYDDWIAAGEAEMDRLREEPRERTVSDE
jgi:hypothetical protein